ncbi:CCE_0567 family metalloprotein [Azospira restricta]|uniref:Rop-like protein n=1 Tax=Azospira restricta TaxID=404405 RepID=A0A974SRI5_9RHOO|nr:CCE_0567 family metalloprotein [Azospira restricta]QRJ65008.1 hypothetical protein IWH25_06615 [Azospira restricta]
MDDADLQALDKEVRRLKRIAAEHAAALHDLAEERLPAAWAELPALSAAAYEACQAWAAANARLLAAQKG